MTPDESFGLLREQRKTIRVGDTVAKEVNCLVSTEAMVLLNKLLLMLLSLHWVGQ